MWHCKDATLAWVHDGPCLGLYSCLKCQPGALALKGAGE